ncbi:phosphoribosyltransferase family protein [Desulfotalea psychrophila]|uniref:Related to adenine phosphoribosyltransferase n=1 Tax=Desulfotalea psychrophila (strain LSv54 / DSM 12343) TaxID=177439 RepID=Q6AN29_DESPS|nr:phosphoribosyltransferase family protein [Desulfotalea psychrophila]CAG36245.1 related to adenine phosphoribosyltransferase [Desulfotalea psychrophila LSv54]
MQEIYKLEVAGLSRELPIVPISETLAIASFVIMGDTEMVSAVSPVLAEKLPEFDILVTAEAKGIPLICEMARILGLARYCVARKSVKGYMLDPVIDEVQSITTAHRQILCLDGKDAAAIKGKRVVLVDDVISTGGSLVALESLVNSVGGTIVAKAAILAEGDAIGREDIIYLQELPLFPIEG